MHAMRQFNSGFTLIELVVTVAMVSLLASLAFPMLEVAKKRSKEQELNRALMTIRDALDRYKQAGDEGRIIRKVGETGYPPSLQVLVSGIEDAKSPDRRMMYFLRRVPRDPFHPDLSVSPERTWGLRSSSSPADKPEAGDDVFDVYSLSDGIGLNGISYHDW